MSVERVIVEADLEGFVYSDLSPTAEARIRRFLQHCIGKTPAEVLALMDTVAARAASAGESNAVGVEAAVGLERPRARLRKQFKSTATGSRFTT
jgi:hypothetical protein